MLNVFNFYILHFIFSTFFLFSKTAKSATVWKCLPLISSISIPSSGFTRPPHHPHHILTAETRKPPNYDYYLINSIETCLKEISLQNSQWRVCLCFFCFGRQDGTLGPSPLVTFGQRPRSVPGRQFKCRKKLNERISNHTSEKGIFCVGQQQINKTIMHIMMCWMCSTQISILQMPIAKAREPCDSSKPLSAWQQFLHWLHWLHWYHSRVYCFKCWRPRSKMRKIPIVVAVTKAPCEI